MGDIVSFVEKAQEIRILVGINVDKLIAQASAQGLLFDPNAEKSIEDFYASVKKMFKKPNTTKP